MSLCCEFDWLLKVLVNQAIMLARIGRYGSDYDIANPLIVDNDICLVCGYPLLF